MRLKTIYLILIVAFSFVIMNGCEREKKDDSDYPEYEGNIIYSNGGNREISSIYWISDDEILVLEHESIFDTIKYYSIYNFKIIDIHYGSIKSYELDKQVGSIRFSVLSENKKFIYYTVNRTYLHRLDLTTGEQVLLLDCNCQNLTEFCVSNDNSKTAYPKSQMICLYDIPNDREDLLTEGRPFFFSNDNEEIIYYRSVTLPLYSYNLESRNSQSVFSKQIIKFQNIDFSPIYCRDVISRNDHTYLLIAGTEDRFLLYDLTEDNPVCIVSFESYRASYAYNDDYLICDDWGHHGCNFSIDIEKMKMYSWAFDCMDTVFEGFGIRCSSYRYNLYCTDMLTNEKTRIGNILNKYPGTTVISPNGTKLAYISGDDRSHARYFDIAIYDLVVSQP